MLSLHVHSHGTSSRTNICTIQTWDLNLNASHVICFNMTLHVCHVLSCVSTVTTCINPSFFVAFCVDDFIQLLQYF